MIVYSGDGSYSVYTFTYNTVTGYYSYTKVYYDAEGSSTTTYGVFTPSYTYNDDGTVSTMTVDFDDGSIAVFTYTYNSNGTTTVKTVTTLSDGTTFTSNITYGTIYTYNTDGTISTMTVYYGSGIYAVYTYTYNTAKTTIT
jgi:hypothetical protein